MGEQMIGSSVTTRGGTTQVLACRSVEANYQPTTATVQQKKEYAHCVETLHPDPLPYALVISLKVVFVLSLLMAVYCANREWDWVRGQPGASSDVIKAAGFGFFLIWAASACIGIVCYGLAWVVGYY